MISLEVQRSLETCVHQVDYLNGGNLNHPKLVTIILIVFDFQEDVNSLTFHIHFNHSSHHQLGFACSMLGKSSQNILPNGGQRW